MLDALKPYLTDPHSLGMFLIYFGTFMGQWAVFNLLYIVLTPCDDFALIRDRKLAPAIALIGAELGFMLPMCAASYVTKTWIAFVGWGAISGLVQLTVCKLLYLRYPQEIEKDNCAVALVFAGAALCAGLANAFSMIP